MARLVSLLLLACGGGTPDAPSQAPSGVINAPTPRPAPASKMTVPAGNTDARPAPSSCPAGMLPVPGGRFVMGQSGGEAGTDERFVHLVMLDGYCMDRTEAVQPGSAQPWVDLSWEEAQAACAARSARLPTEAEWEKAARGGCELGSDPARCDDEDARLFPWGDDAPTCSRANHSVVGPRGPQRCSEGPGPVDGQSAGAGPYGHLNLAGNVWEYVSDYYHPAVYRKGRPENPGGPNVGRYRSLRGGAWDTFSTNMRASNRFNDHLKGSTVGFRCVTGPAPVIETLAAVEWSKASLTVRNRSGKPVQGRWLVVTAFDALDIDAHTGLPAPGRSPLAEIGLVPNGEPSLSVDIEIPSGVPVRFSAALDVGKKAQGVNPAASSGGIGWADRDYTAQGDAKTGITLQLAPLPAHPRSPKP